MSRTTSTSSLYSKLESDRHIRLLKLAPKIEGLDFKCELSQHRLAEAPAYSAVSYVWGTQHPPTVIMCNGHSVKIGPSVAWGLKQVQGTTSPAVLWIDRLCINQQDEEEKSRQVRLMGKIFESAENVLAWLGPDVYDDGPVAFGILNQANTLNDVEWETKGTVGVEELNARTHAGRGLPAIGSGEWDRLFRFLESPWFSRSWILQEATVDRPVYLFFGEQIVPLSPLLEGGTWLHIKRYVNIRQDRSDNTLLLRLFLLCAVARSRTSTARNRKGLHTLSYMLADTNNFSCSEPKDRVYSLLGIVQDGQSLNTTGEPAALRADYSRETLDIFRSVARHIISTDSGPPQRLQEIQGRMLYLWWRFNYHTPGWPTWVPQWHGSDFHTSFGQWNQMEAYYCATKAPPIQIEDSGTRRDPHILRVRGVVIDSVKSVHGALSHIGQTFYDGPRSVWEIVRSLWSVYQGALAERSMPQELNAIDEVFTFLCTITGMVHYLNKPAEVVVADFAAWCRHVLLETHGTKATRKVNKLLLQLFDRYLTGGKLPEWLQGNNGDHESFFSCFRYINKSLVITQKAHIGLTIWHAKAGDRICVVSGCPMPLLLRPVKGHYEHMGLCHFPKIRWNDVQGLLAQGHLEWTTLEIW